MRRFDKSNHIEKVNILLEKRLLMEKIHASEAYRDIDAIMTVLNGKRSVAFLRASAVKEFYDEYIKGNQNVGLMTVERDGVGDYGNAYILYTDIDKAKKLHSVLMKHGGYLEDNTPEEAIENGESVEYHDEDIKDFVDKHYGAGSYDKVKKNNR